MEKFILLRDVKPSFLNDNTSAEFGDIILNVKPKTNPNRMDKIFDTSGYEFVLEKNNQKGSVAYAREIGKYTEENLKKIEAWRTKLNEYKKIGSELSKLYNDIEKFK